MTRTAYQQHRAKQSLRLERSCLNPSHQTPARTNPLSLLTYRKQKCFARFHHRRARLHSESDYQKKESRHLQPSMGTQDQQLHRMIQKTQPAF